MTSSSVEDIMEDVTGMGWEERDEMGEMGEMEREEREEERRMIMAPT